MNHSHRRAFLKGLAVTATGAALTNWGGLTQLATSADAVKKTGKRCILLWMAGGASHLDTFDMKMGRRGSGPFRPIATKVSGIQVCEYLPNIAKQADRLAIIRGMSTSDPDHGGGTYLMHTGYRKEAVVRHPELGAMVAKYLGSATANLPSFIQMGLDGGESSPVSGSGFLGPAYQPFKMGNGGRMPMFTTSSVTPESDVRRRGLLKAVEDEFLKERKAEAFDAYRQARGQMERLMKARGVFDVSKDWAKAKDRYGDTSFGKNCLLARKLVEAGVPFVEVGQSNYDSHADNFDWHKGLLPVLDQAWAGLLDDLHERGLLKDTLVVWMGEFGRTPGINNRSGRDHYAKAWSVVLAGGGVKGGVVHGKTDADGAIVTENKVTEGDLFATLYTALGINPRVKHFAGTRPVWATPEDARPVKAILA